MPLPKEWRLFATRYGQDEAYWYAPKGLAANAQALRARLQVLKSFEGGKTWRDCQDQYVRKLNAASISEAAADWPEGGAPLARMLKQVFVALGLAWIDTAEKIEITPVGDDFLKSKDPDKVLGDQLLRYQFWNPGVKSVAHRAIELHPVPFLGELLRSIDSQKFDKLEYILFVSRAKRFSDMDGVIKQIEEFRRLSSDMKAAVCRACEAIELEGSNRSSMFNTIKLNRTYALKMYSLSEMLERNDEGGLSLRRGAVQRYRGYLQSYARNGEYIAFDNLKDWIAYFGDPAKTPNRETAIDYYVRKGNVEAAIATKRKATPSGKELRDFSDMIVSEKQIEDHLEQRLEIIGDQIGMKLKLVGRQYSTAVGPIDLLAFDAARKAYVVVELKRGRTADAVFGQCSRYMGWVRKNLAEKGQKVLGVIVAREIDKNLKAARDAHDTEVHFIEFKLNLATAAV
jgi:hypothetical protein